MYFGGIGSTRSQKNVTGGGINILWWDPPEKWVVLFGNEIRVCDCDCFIGDFRIKVFFACLDSKSYMGFSLLRGHEKIIEYYGGLGLD